MALVLCTGLVDERVRRRAEEAGFAAVVSKDDFDALPGIVERAVRGS
jgi:hypothetical protein